MDSVRSAAPTKQRKIVGVYVRMGTFESAQTA